LFFLIYINALLNIIDDPSKPILFADDTSIIIRNPSPAKFKEHINNISDTIDDLTFSGAILHTALIFLKFKK